MRKLLLILLCLCAPIALFADDREQTVAGTQYVYTWQYKHVDFLVHETMPEIKIPTLRTDRGIFGASIGAARIYGDITMPTITSECLVDVGRALSGMGGLLGQCPRWFTMFDPGACPTDELFGAAKANTAIMLTMRTYF